MRPFARFLPYIRTVSPQTQWSGRGGVGGVRVRKSVGNRGVAG